MKSLIRRIPYYVSVSALIFLLFSAACYAIGLRVNTTKSIPLGLYLTQSSTPKKGDYVIICPPQSPVFLEAKKRGYLEAGLCPGELSYMMKKILAAKKDEVDISIDGVKVNGEFLPGSKPFLEDKFGRKMPIPSTNVVLNDSEVLLMGDVSSKSFDARYFGIIEKTQIKSVIHPILIW